MFIDVSQNVSYKWWLEANLSSEYSCKSDLKHTSFDCCKDGKCKNVAQDVRWKAIYEQFAC